MAGCGSDAEPAAPDEQVARPANCPERAKAPAQLPNTAPELATLDYWLSTYSAEQLDELLLDGDALTAHDHALRRNSEGEPRFVDLAHIPSSQELQQELSQHLATWRERFVSGDYAIPDKDARGLFEQAAKAGFVEARALHMALAPIALRCAPLLDVVRSMRGDKRFDRNLCSQARAQEPVEVLGKLGNLRLARSRYAVGFLPPDAALSPRVSEAFEPALREGRELQLTRDLMLNGQTLRAGTMLSAGSADTAYVASRDGVQQSRALGADEARLALRPLTRSKLLSEAFALIGSPYGLGDEGGGRDCSRLILDVLRSFGMHLPRTSARAESGRQLHGGDPRDCQRDRAARPARRGGRARRGAVPLSGPHRPVSGARQGGCAAPVPLVRRVPAAVRARSSVARL